MDPFSSTDKLEREFKQAQQFGRWLSDEERSALEEEETQALRLIEQQQHRRSRLIVLTGVCVLIPPLWGFAAALTFYLLFPETAKRIAMVAGSTLIVALILSIIAFGVLVTTVANIIF